MRPLYIFDLDGTLALIDHRRPLLDESTRDRWYRFNQACDRDAPNAPVIATLEQLRRAGAEVWIFSGRSDEVRGKSEAWLARHTSFTEEELAGPMLSMREAGDTTADDVLKRRWFEAMLRDDRARLVAVFDDREQVVQMWRANGVACFQVADGRF